MTQIVENEGSDPVLLFTPPPYRALVISYPEAPTLPTLKTPDHIAADRQTKLHLVAEFLKIKGTVHKKHLNPIDDF